MAHVVEQKLDMLQHLVILTWPEKPVQFCLHGFFRQLLTNVLIKDTSIHSHQPGLISLLTGSLVHKLSFPGVDRYAF